MKKWLLLCWLWLGLVLSVSVHADVDYSIEAYYGDLLIHEDNSATFKQTIIYVFDSSYKGQYVTLGKAGKMPPDFAISPTPQVVAYRNEHPLNPQTSIETLSAGYPQPFSPFSLSKRPCPRFHPNPKSVANLTLPHLDGETASCEVARQPPT